MIDIDQLLSENRRLREHVDCLTMTLKQTLEAQHNQPAIGYAVSCAGMVSVVTNAAQHPDGTYLLYGKKVSDNVTLAASFEQIKKMVGARA